MANNAIKEESAIFSQQQNEKLQPMNECDDGDSCDDVKKLRSVGPLPHLSSMYYEISKGIPIVPRPATMMSPYFGNTQSRCTSRNDLRRLNNRAIPLQEHENPINQMSSKQTTNENIAFMMIGNGQQSSSICMTPTAYENEDDPVAPSSTNMRQTNPSSPHLSAVSLESSTSSSQSNLQRKRLILWRTKTNEETSRMDTHVVEQHFNHDTVQTQNSSSTKDGYDLDNQRTSDNYLMNSNIINQPAYAINEEEKQWVEYWDEEVGASYYYNTITGEASWVAPNIAS